MLVPFRLPSSACAEGRPLPVGAATDRAGAGAAEGAALVHAVDQRRQHVEFLGVGVLERCRTCASWVRKISVATWWDCETRVANFLGSSRLIMWLDE